MENLYYFQHPVILTFIFPAHEVLHVELLLIKYPVEARDPPNTPVSA